MKRKVTKKHPDGSMEIVEEHDEAPAHHKNELDHKSQGAPPAKQYLDKIADKGKNGDTELAHVNPYEKMMLKAMGGVGTRNPKTGLRQFYINPATGVEDPNYTPTDTAGSFNLPLDIAPYSTSNSNSMGVNSAVNTSNNQSTSDSTQGSYNLGTSTGNTASNNFSGLDQNNRNEIMGAVVPQLTNAVQNMGSNYDLYNKEALGSYTNMMQNTLRENIPLALRNLANRGVINSTDGNNILRGVMSDAAINAGDKGYATAMQTALSKANMPTVLAQLAQLGNFSQGNNTLATSFGNSNSQSTGSSTGTSTGVDTANSTSYQTDPTVMYRTMADLIKSMM
jgi:hypothetical protein